MAENEELRGGIDEYREIGVNWRYWGDVRFKQMTVYFTATGALIAGALRTPEVGADTRFIALLLSVLGITLTIGFLVFEERATFYRRAFMSCAKSLESRLGLPTSQYARTRSVLPVDTGDAYRLFLATVFGVWVTYAAHALLDGVWTAGITGTLAAALLFIRVRTHARAWMKIADDRGSAPLLIAVTFPSSGPIAIPRFDEQPHEQSQPDHHTNAQSE